MFVPFSISFKRMVAYKNASNPCYSNSAKSHKDHLQFLVFYKETFHDLLWPGHIWPLGLIFDTRVFYTHSLMDSFFFFIAFLESFKIKSDSRNNTFQPFEEVTNVVRWCSQVLSTLSILSHSSIAAQKGFQ